MTVGERIKARRKELGMSVETLAKKLGCHSTTVYRYESGYIEKVDSGKLIPIAEALFTTPAELLGYSPVDKDESAPTPPDGVPKTPEARRISAGIDRMPEELRKSVADFMYKSLSQYFDKED